MKTWVMVVAIGALACGGGDSQPQATPAPFDAAVPGPGPDAAGPSSARGACGLDYEWVTGDDVGDVVFSKSRDPISKTAANLLRAGLIVNDVPWGRSIEYETQLHEFRYLTQDRGALVEATGYYIAPVTDSPETLPVIVSLHGTTGLSDSCAPSNNLDDSSSDNFAYATVLSLIAANGYIVVAPDYLGLKASGAASTELHPYLVGEVTATTSWDAVRASQRHLAGLESTGATMGPVSVWGASQGGHAAAFTVRYAPSYAPEFEVVAGVYNVPPLDLATHWQKGLQSPQAVTGFIVMAFVGMADWFRHSDLSDVFVAPFDESLRADLLANCRATVLSDLTGLDQLFQADILADNQELYLSDKRTPWSCAIRENSLATTSEPRTDKVPSLVVTGEVDDLIETAIERDAFAARCATGDYDDWRYLECEGAGHTEGFLWAIDDALDWIDDRIDGKPLVGSCAVTAPVECSNTP